MTALTLLPAALVLAWFARRRGGIGPDLGHSWSGSTDDENMKPPAYISGGKRLNFTRWEPYHPATLTDGFVGEGKSEGSPPSCSWEELCALADLVVKHPAFRLPDEPVNPHYPPRIEEAP